MLLNSHELPDIDLNIDAEALKLLLVFFISASILICIESIRKFSILFLLKFLPHSLTRWNISICNLMFNQQNLFCCSQFHSFIKISVIPFNSRLNVSS